jgi:molybdenum cofactor cytidylyltransferase
VSPSGIACLVLAAGSSTRMGHRNKLLEPLDGTPILTTVVRAALESRVNRVTVVTGHDRARVEECISGLPVDLLWNPDHVLGISTSLKAGLATVPEGTEAVVVCLGDMPRVLSGHIDALVQAFLTDRDGSIFVPTWEGRRGNPVLWSSDMFAEFQTLGGDVGAKVLMSRHATLVREIPVDTTGILMDVDTPESLQELSAADESLC